MPIFRSENLSLSKSYASRQGQDDTTFMLDTAFTNHVFHQQSRFINYERVDHPIKHISAFHVNIIAYKAFKIGETWTAEKIGFGK
ncbi:hypothetical protein OnM2_047059 [Erysiphe neolycopersici]|uniref:Uncharacterized protein n=1 Tax=Erysiphe neolycopersici TaxID=212602 RepID=A0A420HTJ9_9PEZI|nr:hypothetical protein OnM2_047059 [Erysiphe neolycopersici]